ncbi:hypothetical protein AKJ16_DCAP18638 [Drosera capensis]
MQQETESVLAVEVRSIAGDQQHHHLDVPDKKHCHDHIQDDVSTPAQMLLPHEHQGLVPASQGSKFLGNHWAEDAGAETWKPSFSWFKIQLRTRIDLGRGLIDIVVLDMMTTNDERHDDVDIDDDFNDEDKDEYIYTNLFSKMWMRNFHGSFSLCGNLHSVTCFSSLNLAT